MDLSSPDLPGLLLCWVGVITMPASGGAVGLQGMMCLRGWLGCEGGCLREQMRVSDQVATTSRVSKDALCTWSDPCACARPPGLSPDPGRGCALGTPPPRPPRALGGSAALERNEVVEGLAVLPEPLESRLISSRRSRAILCQTKSTIFPVQNPL